MFFFLNFLGVLGGVRLAERGGIGGFGYRRVGGKSASRSV